MVGFLIVAHGDLAFSLLATAKMIVGNVPCAEAVAFNPAEGVEDLEEHIDAALKKLDGSDWVLALTDLLGGSPANVLGKKVLLDKRIELLTGVNAPMLLEAVLSAEAVTRRELLEKSLEAGREGIVNLRAILEED